MTVHPGAADGLPEYLRRLLDAAVDLPLRHRMPQATATARRSAVLILFGEGPRGTPCVHDGHVYTFGNTGILAC